MKVPYVTEGALGYVYRMFRYREDEVGLHLNFVEPVANSNGERYWKIEYRVATRTIAKKFDMRNFVQRLQQAKGSFRLREIQYNFDTRFYLFIDPSETRENEAISNTTVTSVTSEQEQETENKEASVIAIRLRDNAKTVRNKRRSELFAQQIKELEEKAVVLGYTVTAEEHLIPLNIRKQQLEKYIRIKERSLDHPGLGMIHFKKSEDVNPALEHAEALKIAGEKLPSKPISKIVSMSVGSTEQRYAKSRLLNREMLTMVRSYLSILCDRNYEVVTTSGDTRLGLEIRLKSEGFPIGEELKTLYCDALKERGYTEEQIESDLNALKTYEQTSRIIRLQTAREKTRSWYGLKGGQYIEVIEKDYHQMRQTPDFKRKSVLIFDELGEIKKFN